MPLTNIGIAAAAMVSRAWRAIRLDPSVFREAAADKSATYQALAIVFLGGLATAAGNFFGNWGALPAALPAQLFLAYVGWITGTVLVLGIGRMLLPSNRSGAVGWTEIARAMGFAHAPILLRVMAVLPGIGLAVLVLSLLWQGIAMLIGIKEVLGYQSYWKPLGIIAIGFVPYVVVVAGFSRLV
ncbi:MAG: hypothetical protein WD533_03835 [Dehalococcoidia bacterium]